MSAEARRPQDLLRAVLRNTRISVVALGLAVVADLLSGHVRLPLFVFEVAPIASLVGVIACCAHARGRGLLAGLVSIGISLYAGLATLFVAFDHLLIGD